MLSLRAKLAVTAATVAAGLGTWVGVTCGCPVPFFPDPAQTANVWVNPAGSDAGANCVRQSSAAEAPADLTTVCLTWQKAYQLASLGDTVGVTSGAYVAQTMLSSVTKTVTNGTCNAAVDFQGGSPTYTNCVTFEVANNTTATLPTMRVCVNGFRLKQNTGGSFISPGYLTVGSGDNTCRTRPHDIVLTGGLAFSAFVLDGPYNFAALAGVTFGPQTDNASIIAGGYNGPLGNSAVYDAVHDILFDGVTWHDYYRTSTGVHMECLHVTQQGDDFVVRNSKFKNCANYDISFQPSGLATANSVWTDILIENNFFDTPCSHKNPTDACGPGGLYGLQVLMTGASGAGSVSNMKIRFNSIGNTINLENDCGAGCPFTTSRIYGNNIASACPQSSAGFGAGWTQDYNVWSGAGGAGTICSGDSTSLYSTSNGFVDAATYDFHIGTGAAAKNLVPAAISGGAPAADIDVDSRPISTNFDAGADERS